MAQKKTQLVVSDVVALARKHGLVADENPETGAKNFIVVHRPGERKLQRMHLGRGKGKTSWLDVTGWKPERTALLTGFDSLSENKQPSGTVTHRLGLDGVTVEEAMLNVEAAFSLLAEGLVAASPAEEQVEQAVAVAAEEPAS